VASAPPKQEVVEKEEPPKFGVAYLNNPRPEYPRLSQRAGEEGKVVMKVLVSVEGRPDSVEVISSSGFERLDKAAVAAVKQWRFEPARKGGKALSAYVNVPLSFSLTQE
jgi:protein TonB